MQTYSQFALYLYYSRWESIAVSDCLQTCLSAFNYALNSLVVIMIPRRPCPVVTVAVTVAADMSRLRDSHTASGHFISLSLLPPLSLLQYHLLDSFCPSAAVRYGMWVSNDATVDLYDSKDGVRVRVRRRKSRGGDRSMRSDRPRFLATRLLRSIEKSLQEVRHVNRRSVFIYDP